MSEKKVAYITAYMQTLAGEEIELNDRLLDTFSGVLMRQLEEDADGSIDPKSSYEMLAKVFTFVATPGNERPVSPNHYSEEQIAQAEAAANDAVSSFDPNEDTIDVDIDTAAFPTEANFDASGDAYNFIDDAAVSNYAVIANFTEDDTISFLNADVNDYSFSNEGEDVTLSYNYNDEGTMNVIKLTGVVSSDALVYDLASFTAALGFDPFG